MMRANHAAALRAASLILLLRMVASSAADRLTGEAVAAMDFLSGRGLVCFEALRKISPPLIGPDQRAAILRQLPAEGELEPDAEEQKKLQGVDAVLRVHDRAGAVVVKLIDVSQAAVALHAGCVLLVSRPALTLLSGPEMQALAAHEIGHAYFWSDYQRATASGDTALRRRLELRSDAVALLTLARLGIPARYLHSALVKLERFNRRFGNALNAEDYPPAGSRATFQQRFLRAMSEGGASTCAAE